MSIIKIGI